MNSICVMLVWQRVHLDIEKKQCNEEKEIEWLSNRQRLNIKKTVTILIFKQSKNVQNVIKLCAL